MKSVQYFSDEYLEQCKKMKPLEICRFLENFRLLHASRGKVRSKLISMKVSEPLLNAFQSKAQLYGIPYQTQIKKLMQQCLKGEFGSQHQTSWRNEYGTDTEIGNIRTR